MLIGFLVVVLGLFSLVLTLPLTALALADWLRLPKEGAIPKRIVIADILQWTAITTLYGAALFYSLPSGRAALILAATITLGLVASIATLQLVNRRHKRRGVRDESLKT